MLICSCEIELPGFTGLLGCTKLPCCMLSVSQPLTFSEKSLGNSPVTFLRCVQ